MLARFGWMAWLALAWPQEPEPPLAPLPVRQKLRTLTSEIARSGEPGPIERMRAVLAALGDEAEDLERLARGWERTLAGAKPGRSTRTAAAGRLRRELAPLVQQLEREAEPRRSELARWILELDSEVAEANSALGRARAPGGEWLTAEEAGWREGAKRIAGLVLDARALKPTIEHGPSDNPSLLAVAGGGNRVRAHGAEVHSRLPPAALERILTQALRGAALSHWILFGTPLPAELRERRWVLLDTEAHLRPALDEALAAEGITPQAHHDALALDMASFLDQRGWRTVRWHREADLAALVLWDLLVTWFPADAQPCLRVGHLNWLCLTVLGASMPVVLWSEDVEAPPATQRTSAQREEAFLRQSLWRSARQSLWGCRAWMKREVRAGRNPLWVRAMLDQDGKIRDREMLKTTLACELLQQEGRLAALVEATKGKQEPAAAFEAALGEPLWAFEERWKRWLDPERRPGLVQELEHGAPAPGGAGPFDAALRLLNQARADALSGQSPEIPLVTLDPELSRAAELHARYLTLNPDQKARWPAAHEEYAGAPGFTPEGSLAGGRAVIAFTGDPVNAVESWLGTFYHRLPLLAPGLFGVGFGASEEVVVLDAGSLVLAPWQDHVVRWPLDGAEGVPRAFVPELPNPVPREDMARLGYPISLQLFQGRPRDRTELELELFAGAPADGRRVDCHFVTPTAPLQIELAPENAWCLIPKAPLAKRTRYTVRARLGERLETWSFTTGE
jgi:hypothetical protein